MFASASGVADCPRMAWARSPGRSSVPAKISTETTRRVPTPSARRWATSFKTGCSPRRRRSDEIKLLATAQSAEHRGGHQAVDLGPAAEQHVVEHRDDLAAVLVHHHLQVVVHLLALVGHELALRLEQQLVELRPLPERLV